MKKEFKAAMASPAGISALIPTGPQITEAQLKKLAKERKAAGIGVVGRPKRKDKDNDSAPAAEKGTRPGEMRKTYLVNKEQAEKLDRIAYWQRIKVKDALADALQAYISGYEKKNGSPKAIPKK